MSNCSLTDQCNIGIDPLPSYEPFTEDELRSGAIIIHVIVMIYMFLSLAIVCDEYFVPSLEVIIDRFKISPDVAGATLMAAGGSMPELFTSLIGTMSGSDVGFGTIVGSAVFNVLFVIGCCAIFARETLTLTWWPLFRDCVCYCTSLIVLAVFFGIASCQEIHWYESLILLGMYLLYCIMMAHNERLRNWISGSCCKSNKVHADGAAGGSSSTGDGEPTITRSSSSPGKQAWASEAAADGSGEASLKSPRTFDRVVSFRVDKVDYAFKRPMSVVRARHCALKPAGHSNPGNKAAGLASQSFASQPSSPADLRVRTLGLHSASACSRLSSMSLR